MPIESAGLRSTSAASPASSRPSSPPRPSQVPAEDALVPFNVRGYKHAMPRSLVLSEPASLFARSLDNGLPMATDKDGRVLVDMPRQRWLQICDWLRCGALARKHDPQLAAEASYWGFQRLHAALQGVEVGLFNVRGQRMELPRDLADARDPNSRLAQMLAPDSDLPRDAHGVPYLNLRREHLDVLLDWYGCGAVPASLTPDLFSALQALGVDSLERRVFAPTLIQSPIADYLACVLTVPHLGRQLEHGRTIAHDIEFLGCLFRFEIDAAGLRLTGKAQDLALLRPTRVRIKKNEQHFRDLDGEYWFDKTNVPHAFGWTEGTIDLKALSQAHSIFSFRPNAVDFHIRLGSAR